MSMEGKEFDNPLDLQSGDWVCDMDGEPDPGTNKGLVEKVMDNGLVRVIWKDGKASERPARKLAKIGPITSHYAPDPARRKAMWDKILQMSDEEIAEEIARLEEALRSKKLN